MTQRFPSTTVRTRLADVIDWLASVIACWFEVDLRALAAVRISLGLLLLADLVTRARNLGAFYTDAGVLPREALFSDYTDVYSLHALSGEAWFQAALFCVAGAFALALVVGYRTRLATIASWLLLVSLHVRNPMVLNGGDALLRILLLWAIFLPLGERWSIDADRSTGDRTTVTSIATMALLLQVVLMYVTNTIHKFRGDLWLEGEALVYIFSADQFTFLLGDVLAEYHALLEAGTYLWLALLVCSPLLFALTGRVRAILPTLFVGMHVGMLVTMPIMLFPLVVVAALLPFYPPIVWDRVEHLAAEAGLFDLLEAVRKRLSVLPSPPSVSVPTGTDVIPSGVVDRSRTVVFTIVPYLLLALVVMSNAQAVGYAEMPDAGERTLDAAQAEQSWRMFAPNPVQTTRWFAAPAELENGSEVDVLHRSQVDLDRPESVDDTYPTGRWRKYLSNVQSADNEKHESYLANYLCERWNSQHRTDVSTVKIYYMYDRVDPYTGERDVGGEVELLEYDCSGPFVQED